MIFDGFWHQLWFCKQLLEDLKNDKDLDNICSKEILGKDTNLFAEICLQIQKTSKDPFYIKVLPSFEFLRLPNL